MTGLEVLGALSAALSVLKASTHLFEIVHERLEFERQLDSALDVAELLEYQWKGLRTQLDDVQLDDGQLAQHAQRMDHRLREAHELLKVLVKRGRVANIKILLGFGTVKLKELNSMLEHLVIRQNAMEFVFMRWSTTDLRRRMSRSMSLPLSPDDFPLENTLNDDRSESPPLLDTISRSSTLPVGYPTVQRSHTVASSSPSIIKSKKPASVILTGDVISEKDLLRNGLKNLKNFRNPNILVENCSGTKTTLLHWLIKRWKGKEILDLVSGHGIDINAVDSANLTPLHHAVNMPIPNKIEVVKLMVRRGADFGGKRPPKLTGNGTKEVSAILQQIKCV